LRQINELRDCEKISISLAAGMGTLWLVAMWL